MVLGSFVNGRLIDVFNWSNEGEKRVWYPTSIVSATMKRHDTCIAMKLNRAMMIFLFCLVISGSSTLPQVLVTGHLITSRPCS